MVAGPVENAYLYVRVPVVCSDGSPDGWAPSVQTLPWRLRGLLRRFFPSTMRIYTRGRPGMVPFARPAWENVPVKLRSIIRPDLRAPLANSPVFARDEARRRLGFEERSGDDGCGFARSPYSAARYIVHRSSDLVNPFVLNGGHRCRGCFNSSGTSRWISENCELNLGCKCRLIRPSPKWILFF